MQEHPVQIPALNLTTTDPAVPGWHRETTFLRDYLHEPGAVIFVIGAYNGTIAQLLIEQEADARFYLFEPQDWAAAQLREKFGHLPNVKVCEFGLGDCSGTFRMGLYQTYFCSFMRGSQELKGADTWFDGRLVEIGDFLESEGIAEVYYASINIEGYEFVLLPHMAGKGLLERVRTIGISWHGPDCTWLGQPVHGQEAEEETLAKTHDLVLSIDNWQSWARREKAPEILEPLPFEPEPPKPKPVRKVKAKRRTKSKR